MPDDDLINRVNDSVFDAIEVTWPEVIVQNGRENGVWFTEDIKSIPFDQLRPPYAVVQVGEFATQQDYGPTHAVDLATYMVHYVRSVEQTDRLLRNRVRRLVNYLRAPAHDLYLTVQGADAMAQTERVTGPITGDILPLNREFIEREINARAAALSLRVLTKEPYA